MSEPIEVEATSGDVHIKAVHTDDGLRSWQVTHGSDYYSYTSRDGDGSIDPADFERTDTVNISSDGTRYTGDFCSYSADATIYKEDGSDEPFFRSAPDFGTEPASEEFQHGWDVISQKHEEVQQQLAGNPDYIKASSDVKEQLGPEISEGFFNKPSNDVLTNDAALGEEREIPSSIFWAEEIDTLDSNLMNPEAPVTDTLEAEVPALDTSLENSDAGVDTRDTGSPVVLGGLSY